MIRLASLVFAPLIASVAMLGARDRVAAPGAVPHVLLGGSGAISTQIRSHGVLLTLSLPSDVYPANALVPATISLQNNSERAIETWDCLAYSLSAEVIDRNGIILYPPLMPPPGAPWRACPLPPPTVHIAPGETITRQMYVVLRTFSVRASAEIRFSSTVGKPLIIETPSIHIRPSSLPSPRLALQTAGPVRAIVTPVRGGGPLLLSDWAQCRKPRGLVRGNAPSSIWTPAGGITLSPYAAGACSDVLEWHLWVGQVGLPVARVDYCAQRDQCDYPPPLPRAAVVATKLAIPQVAVNYTLSSFSQALVAGNARAARVLLAPTFKAQCAPQGIFGAGAPLPELACLTRLPRSYSIDVERVDDTKALAHAVYDGQPRTISLVHEPDGWRIALVAPVQG